MNQLRLFPAAKPLVERLGEDFFRAAPRAPGIYIMTGEAERVLYIGQSRNLRVRLSSYKNAKPDRSPRKIIRLVHQVRSIVWEKCDTAETAKLRESELLRLHRPKFNVADTFPVPPRFFSVGWDGLELELDCWTAIEGRTPPPTNRVSDSTYGPFKSSAQFAYAALLRLMWWALNPARACANFPAGFFNQKAPRPCRFQVTIPDRERFHASITAFLGGASLELISIFKAILPDDADLSPFARALLTNDLEILTEFFRIGPARNPGAARSLRS